MRNGDKTHIHLLAGAMAHRAPAGDFPGGGQSCSAGSADRNGREEGEVFGGHGDIEVCFSSCNGKVGECDGIGTAGRVSGSGGGGAGVGNRMPCPLLACWISYYTASPVAIISS